MGRHKHSKSHSKSRSRSDSRHKHNKKRDKKKQQSPEKDNPRVRRANKWSDKPPMQPPQQLDPSKQILFEQGIISIHKESSIPTSAITIGGIGVGGERSGIGAYDPKFEPQILNQGAIQSMQNPLAGTQKELFTSLLNSKNDKDQQDLIKQSFTINDPQTSIMNINNEILADAGINKSDQGFTTQITSPNSIFSIINPQVSMSMPSLPTGGILGQLGVPNPASVNINIMGPYQFYPGMNPNLINTLNDPTKVKKKLYVPKHDNFNYIGLIIGPKGSNQKRLEEESQCKILVRGKGSQKEGQPPQPDDDEDQHVLVVGNNEPSVMIAVNEIERIFNADEETRNKIRQEQLKIVAQLKHDPAVQQNTASFTIQNQIDLSLTTPYGPPSQDAYIIPVPNDCVGLVIGKGGETIKMLQINSGARKVQVAADSAQGSNTRNVFVEGEQDAIEKVKKMLQDIVENQQKMKNAQLITQQQEGGGGQRGPMMQQQQHQQQPYEHHNKRQHVSESSRVEVPVPNNLVGLIIGRGGETIKSINNRTGAFVFIPKECEPGSNERILIVTGLPEQINAAKQEIEEIVNMGQKNIAMKVAIQQPPVQQQQQQPQPIHQQQIVEQQLPIQYQQNQFIQQRPQVQQPVIPPTYYQNTVYQQQQIYPQKTPQQMMYDQAYYQQQLYGQSNVITETIIDDKTDRKY